VLSKDNLSELSFGISPQQLPKTFADAVEITRKLEVQYIWIDSLCIVQDDEDDWRRESALMEHVYGGSHLNIAASSATSVHGGCWVATKGMQSTFRTKVSVGDRELVREIRDDNCYDVAVWESHLATRAWALQEKLPSILETVVLSGNVGIRSPTNIYPTALRGDWALVYLSK
jgi:hypothetical protein